jgi:hypothetical protein
MPSRILIPVLAAAALLAGGTATTPAGADVGQGPPVGLGLHQPVLRPVLHAFYVADGGTYAFTARVYLKVGAKTIARLPSFAGTAGDDVQTPIDLKVSTSARHAIRVAARRTHHKRMALLVVFTVALPPPPAGTVSVIPPATSQTYGSPVFLTIPGLA